MTAALGYAGAWEAVEYAMTMDRIERNREIDDLNALTKNIAAAVGAKTG